MARKFVVTKSPHAQDANADLPWNFDEEGFVQWVDEVFFEGYKNSDTPVKSADDGVAHLRSLGYEVTVVVTEIPENLPEPQSRLFAVIRAVQPDIIGISWDRQDVDIICPTGKTMDSCEFHPASLTRSVLDALEDYLRENNYPVFEYRLTPVAKK